MRDFQRVAAAALLVFGLNAARVQCEEPPVPTALQDYVAKKDDSYKLEVVETKDAGIGSVTTCVLTSQTWQGIVWKHALMLYVPHNPVVKDHCLLFINGGSTGGKPSAKDQAMALALARLSGGPVATLHAVPNQPLFGGRKEDDLITETFLRYLESKDATWPLLFPMVKSAVKAIDAVQTVAERNLKQPIKSFVVTGASKRGWTTWLSGVADKRVIGIAPIVIDTLNFRPQMKHQMDTWGAYSEQIIDYSSKGLIDVMQNKPEIPLWRWVDPYTYRKQLTMPKLLVNGTNDPYWVVDALNNYWDDLSGSKHVFYVPNAGHNLEPGKERALATIATFSRLTALGKKLPEMEWKFNGSGNGKTLSVKSAVEPKDAKVWVAHSDTKDFRKSKWESKPFTLSSGWYTAEVPKPATGHYAVHGTLTFEDSNVEYSLSTQVKWE